jgi:2-methylisocitrate lyase-like PEP mutase family enzyme
MKGMEVLKMAEVSAKRDQAKRYRELLAQPGPILSPGVYDCVSAKAVERAGFPAAGISGAAVTASVLGIRTSVFRQ